MPDKKFDLRKKIYAALLVCCCLQFPGALKAQRNYYDSISKEKLRITLDFLSVSHADRIADIGTGTGYSLVPIAAADTTVHFIAEDIDSNSCNRSKMAKQIKKQKSNAKIDQFSFHYGTESSTGLPTAAYNKVLMFDVLHEIALKKEMLADISRIMEKNGSLFISEILVHHTIKKDKVCNYPFLTEDQLKKIMAENNFVLIKEKISYDQQQNRYMKLFEYRRKD